MRYRVIGDNAAPAFFSVSDSGEVKVKANLREHFETEYTVSGAVTVGFVISNLYHDV